MRNRYIIVLFFSTLFIGCSNNNKFQSYKINEKEYFETKVILENIFDSLLENNQESFYPLSYDTETMVFLDTILFNKSKNKMVIFVIDEVKNSKQYEAIKMSKKQVEELDLPYKGTHYNGTIYIGKKDSTKKHKLYWVRTVLDDFDKDELSKDLIEEASYLFSNEKKTNKNYFWENSELWKELE